MLPNMRPGPALTGAETALRSDERNRQRAKLDQDSGGAESVFGEGGIQLSNFTVALKRNRTRCDGVAESFRGRGSRSSRVVVHYHVIDVTGALLHWRLLILNISGLGL